LGSGFWQRVFEYTGKHSKTNTTIKDKNFFFII